eukprot:c36350_g1_i1.p1 GENE.c36350_g1_i1~~c36350_g1_i1.p1  ORF type:complete len:233 (-),score=64.26 c36350_g1_i1:17-715(-)
MTKAQILALAQSIKDEAATFEKQVENWSAGVQAQSNATLDKQQTLVTRSLSNLQKCKQDEAACHQRASEVNSAQEMERSEEERLHQSVQQLRVAEQSSNKRLQEVSQRLLTIQATLSSLEVELQRAMGDNVKLSEDNRSILTKFRKFLGLQFERVSDGHVRFVFENIDAANPSKQFFFSLHVSDEGHYSVGHVEPRVTGVTTLLQTLHETNNISNFALGMRRLFQRTCRTNE